MDYNISVNRVFFVYGAASVTFIGFQHLWKNPTCYHEHGQEAHKVPTFVETSAHV